MITLRRIIAGGEPIRYVLHDEDGDWQFLDGGDVSEEAAVVVGLGEMLEFDPSLAELADLPDGWCALRSGPGEPWRREPA